ncbi:hypothetical protein QYE76_059790 [Lolium multiflorum]|uniref:ubiquitinyl hydrolase 1 n=1 Tax=Lolium multiflorum TaxID=4521 RepID=A0AAD8RZZ8_LOLMU|nr:OVARIAN TUMOR DOMAIN-containing deubiquitinating enzyme 12-like [Lolium perenne]XP_051231052.1 OVARIAN TUMOR DOMAIN-containing deubiquitinating enzyme 12-like [Lolium perenne]KAK1641985.1 hypothetical protein QYE76_059790 [Lolium multiflorum]
MVLRDQDLDTNIVRWGLHHLLDGGGAGYGHCARLPQTPTTDYAPTPPPPQTLHALLGGPGHCAHHPQPPTTDYAPQTHHALLDSGVEVTIHAVESDEVIAHALQEELAQVAMAEAEGGSADDEQRATVLAQQWFRPEIVHHLPSAPPYVEEEQPVASRDHFSSCSSPEDNDAQDCPIELVDDFSAIDGEVGKRLNDMLPVPHVPKTNGEIPSVDEAFSDHRRLLDRLVLYGLVELKVNGDGNCQFRALSDQFYRTPEHHRFVRQQVMKQLESHPEIYAGYVPMDYREYLKKMPKNGEWGDHVTLQAAADSYGVKIFILTSFRDTCYIEILPVVQKSKRVICLSFWAEVHYNSIYPEGELPVVENRKKSLSSDRPSFCSTM